MPKVGETVCKCGRAYTHCRNVNCGGHNLYPLKYRSMSKSLSIGRQITVYRCKKCGNETDETMECQATQESVTTDFKPYKKPEKPHPSDGLTPGTEPYFKALNEFVVELTDEKRITVIQAYVEAFKQGWSFQGIEVDPDIIQALSDAGLSMDSGAGAHGPGQSGGVHGFAESRLSPTQAPLASPLTSSLVSPQQVSLDEIIKGMQEEQK